MDGPLDRAGCALASRWMTSPLTVEPLAGAMVHTPSGSPAGGVVAPACGAVVGPVAGRVGGTVGDAQDSVTPQWFGAVEAPAYVNVTEVEVETFPVLRKSSSSKRTAAALRASNTGLNSSSESSATSSASSPVA